MSMVMGGGRHARSRAPRNARGPLLALAIGGAEFGCSWFATASTAAAVSLSAGVLLLSTCFVWPAAMMAAAFPASFATWRVGPAVIDMSVADFIAFLAAVASLPFVPWHGKAFRTVLLATVGYCAVVSVAVVAHPSISAGVEVAHRFVMVMGAVCIGAALVRTGHVTAALRSLVVVASVFAGAAIVDTFTHEFRPAYPLGVAKNAGGVLLTLTFLVVFFAESHLCWRRRVTAPLGALVLVGLAATQSRGAALALVITLAVYFLRTSWNGDARNLVRATPLFLLIAVGLIVMATVSLQSENSTLPGTDSKFTSLGSRQVTYQAAIDQVIRPHPIFGAGPKWFFKPGAPTGEPHNVFIDEAASTGFVGLGALLLFLWALFRVLRGGTTTLERLAWYALAARVLSAMVDIFWVAGPNTLPFLLVGLAIGAGANEVRPVRRSHLVGSR